MDGGAWQATVHGVAKSRTRLSDFTFTFHFHALEKEMATPLQCSCLENPRDRGAWWAAVYGVTQSRTLSSSSRPTPIIYILRLQDQPEDFFQKLSSSSLHYCYINLKNVEGNKVCPFLLLENSRPLSPWGPLDFLSTCLGINFLSASSKGISFSCVTCTFWQHHGTESGVWWKIITFMEHMLFAR